MMLPRLILVISMTIGLLYAVSSDMANYPKLSQAQQPAIWYVSDGDVPNNARWAGVFPSPADIDWGLVGDGDSIQISDGTYGGFSVLKSVSITPEVGAEVVIQGRRGNIPSCGRGSTPAGEGRTYGVVIRADDVKIDGIGQGGITIRGFGLGGILYDKSSDNSTLRNLEITQNGINRSGRMSGSGIRVAGGGHSFHRLNIWNNGQDQIMSADGQDNRLANLSITGSWLHNSANFHVKQNGDRCSHSDGIQIYDGGTIDGVTVSDSIIGPNLMNGLIMGQTGRATVVNVDVSNSLIYGFLANGALAYADSNSRGWKFRQVTVDCSIGLFCLELHGRDHVVQDSILIGGSKFAEYVDASENCEFEMSNGQEWGSLEADPLFDGYRATEARCNGSMTYSVGQLFGNEVRPSATPVAAVPCQVIVGDGEEHSIRNITVIVER